MSQIVFQNRDCLEAMRECPDNFFDLAIVDPPYGAGFTEGGGCKEWFTKYHQPPQRERGVHRAEYGGGNRKDYRRDKGDGQGKKIIAWDTAPPKEYFTELSRISRNQIIFGGNYFELPVTRCFIVWRKPNIPLKGFTMTPVEYAWTSFDRNAVMYEHSSSGTAAEPRFHPTQKPVELYRDILADFAEKGDKILDTHAGSGSLLIACYDMGFDVWGYEIDPIYYQKAQERIDNYTAQLRLNI